MQSCEIYAIILSVSERNTTNNMTMAEIRRFIDAKRKREAKTRENLKRIGEAAAIAAARQFPRHHRILAKKSEVCA